MANSPILSGRSVGTWNRSIRSRVVAENIYGKILSLNLDKIMAQGLPYAVWREASSIQTDLTKCSCFKDTSKQPDIPCQTCYGTGSIPGYFKFGTINYWAASIDAGWTLNNIVLDKDNRPFRFMLTPGQLTGTAVSPNLSISILGKLGIWETKADGFTRDGGVNSSILVEASKNGGSTWFALNTLEAQGPTTQLRFRVTMTRTASTVKTPMFEIVRARFANLFDIRDEIQEPVIRVIPTWDVEAESRTNYGTRIESQGKRLWCMPLAFYDTTIQQESKLARLADDVFIEVRYGATIGNRFAITSCDYSDNMGVFTHQSFDLRRFTGESGKLSGEFALKIF